MNKKSEIANAFKNKSVVKIKKVESNLLMGVKDTSILKPTVKYLENLGYELHTIDKRSYLNRAVDFDLINPITGNFVSGSSSGTALNVFLDINDIGIGSDGGGSVLAPSINLNLYGFISQKLPIIDVKKKSTDNIEFKVSAGIISKDLNKLIDIYEKLNNGTSNNDFQIYYLKADDDPEISNIECQVIKFNKNMSRNEMISFVKKYYETGIVISHETKIDVFGIGDSIVGSLDLEKQLKGNKGLIKVINMCNADAFTLPTNVASSAFVISSINYNSELISICNKFNKYENELISRYFNSNNYNLDSYEE